MSSVLLHRVSVSTFTRLGTRGFVVAAAPSLRRDGIKANLDDRGTRHLLSFAVGAGSAGTACTAVGGAGGVWAGAGQGLCWSMGNRAHWLGWAGLGLFPSAPAS